MLGPILEGEKIRLEPTRPEFLPEFIRWFADMNVTRYLLSRFPMTLKQEEEWFESASQARDVVHWTMVVDDCPIGVTGIHRIDPISRSATTGTIIGVRDAWGKGYATEGVRLRTEFAFMELNLNRLASQSMSPNVGMHKALERSGYRKIGVDRQYMYREGQWIDAVHFELLREEWKPQRQ